MCDNRGGLKHSHQNQRTSLNPRPVTLCWCISFKQLFLQYLQSANCSSEAITCLVPLFILQTQALGAIGAIIGMLSGCAPFCSKRTP